MTCLLLRRGVTLGLSSPKKIGMPRSRSLQRDRIVAVFLAQRRMRSVEVYANNVSSCMQSTWCSHQRGPDIRQDCAVLLALFTGLLSLQLRRDTGRARIASELHVGAVIPSLTNMD